MIRAIGRDAALAALVTIVVVAVVSFAPAPQASRFDGDLHDFGHVLVFGVMGLMLSRTLRRAFTPAPRRRLVTLASLAAGLVFGYGTEYAQGFLGGTPSWGDVARDMLGCAVGSCAAFALERSATPGARRVFWTAALLGIVVGGGSLATTLLDYRARDALFPVLLDSAEPNSRSFVAAFDSTLRVEPVPDDLRPLDANLAARGTPAIRVPLDRGNWPGLTLTEPVRDWRGWRALVIELANPTDAPLRIEVRVNDRLHDNRFEDRYNRGVELPARSRGRFEFPLAEIERAPQGRRMDLTDIAKLVIFHGGPAPGRAFYVERVSLVRELAAPT
jgi:VanZ family protein